MRRCGCFLENKGIFGRELPQFSESLNQDKYYRQPFQPPSKDRSTSLERSGVDVPQRADTEAERWWPSMDEEGRPLKFNGMMHRSNFDRTRKTFDGLATTDIGEVPSQQEPVDLSIAATSYFSSPEMLQSDEESYEQVKKLSLPPTFDPAFDDIDDEGYEDRGVLIDIKRSIEEDRKKLEEFGNPVLVEDQVDYMLSPSRSSNESQAQRAEFNGFVHWGLLHGAHICVEEYHDYERAHQFLNRYLRDVDLFAKWLDHPKVISHFRKKYNTELAGKFDKLMAISMSYYTRAKIQVLEKDPSSALKAASTAISMIEEGGKMDKPRHRKMFGLLLAMRGSLYAKLSSFYKAEEDLTRATYYLETKKYASLYQLRAECRERIGRVEEARADEELAAQIWEEGEVIAGGLLGEPKKFVF